VLSLSCAYFSPPSHCSVAQALQQQLDEARREVEAAQAQQGAPRVLGCWAWKMRWEEGREAALPKTCPLRGGSPPECCEPSISPGPGLRAVLSKSWLPFPRL